MPSLEFFIVKKIAPPGNSVASRRPLGPPGLKTISPMASMF